MYLYEFDEYINKAAKEYGVKVSVELNLALSLRAEEIEDLSRVKFGGDFDSRNLIEALKLFIDVYKAGYKDGHWRGRMFEDEDDGYEHQW